MTLPKMDSRIGLDYIVENREYVSKLGAALDTNNTTVKKQVFELLSALCAYNSEGYARAIETLEYYKNLKNERYRFKIVVNELEKATIVEYQVALLAFINCVIISASSLQDRLRIRNEFIGLKVLPVLNNLRRVAHSVGDIVVQLDVFDEQRECDEAQSLQGSNGINLNSHLDVFYAILRQVADTPQEIPFLSILQHLLRIDSKEAVSDIIWDTAEKLVHRATLLENHEDSARLLRAPSVQKFTCPHCRGEATSPSRKQSSSVVPQPTTPSSVQSPTSVAPSFNPIAAPPPPPPPPAAPPPPPPPLMAGYNNLRPPGAPPAPPLPAPNLLSNNNLVQCNRPKTPDVTVTDSVKLLPQQETPAPKSKMKTINWNKIPPNKVIGKKNIWTIVADSHQDSPMADLDWNEMEGLFCLQSTSAQGSPKLGRDTGQDTLERRTKKENSEITLLDGKRSLNVNIFLKQFRTSNEDIIQLIRNGEHDDIGAEKLRGLLKILPEVDELDMLRSFDGDKLRLGNAEKFLLQLLEVPNYKLRIECMLLKEEFAANVSYLEPCINAMLYAGDDLINNKILREVLYMVVVAGNFLNSGGYAGNAAGVKLSSLQKLTDIRANKPGMNLIHFVALQAEKRNPDLLTFPSQMSALDNASKTTSEQINNEINALDSRIKKIKKQIELTSTEMDIKDQMMEFLQSAEREVTILQRGMKEVENMRIKLSEFFCEDPSAFKIEECFKIFQNFCEKFKQAVQENERRRLQEEQATLRRKQREEQLARRAKQLNQCGTPVSDPENSLLLDPTQFDIRYSPAMSRRRVGSFNSNGDCSFNREDGVSPDITPNGSLRRRRSRILTDEDEGNLMEFLRTSGHDNGSRERKASSYGSLDRSWARRARTGSGCKKRPDLLSIDFGVDRERPSSPSPVTEAKPLPAEENKPRISREWRQKIESWLQANENDEKQNEEYKRKRRLANNRRSLENETESERNKLDPLPEEKVSVHVNGSETYKRVYPDWKPSAALENTDVVGTIEAIEDVHTNTTKDKSSWRKSNLNVPNCSEEIPTSTRLNRRQGSPGLSGSNTSYTNAPLQSIVEEDKRKSVIQQLGDRSASDRLHIYIRRPSEPTENELTPIKSNSSIKSPSSPTKLYSEKNSPRSPLIESSRQIQQIQHQQQQQQDRQNERNSKIEIDSDNIETPPVTRRALTSPIGRKLQAPRPLHPETIAKNLYQNSSKNSNQDVLDTENLGHFDRFSAARRTRRYKRPTDYSSGNEDTSPTSNESDRLLMETEKNSTTKLENDHQDDREKEDRLKRWQDRLRTMSDNKHDSKIKPSDKTVAKLEKVGRHISSINQEDVREAIRNLKSPTGTPERIWSPPRDIVKEKPSHIKASNLELNDEGFEETQSLVSDTPSHGKESTSSCAENQSQQNRSKRTKPIRMTSSDSAATTTSSDAPKSRSISSKSQIQNLLERNKRSFERSRSMRTPVPIHTPPLQITTPRRTSSLRKNEASPSVGAGSSITNKRDVERSSSRTSLRSSRSSLNSGISTSTVRKMPIKSHITSSLESSPSKRPLATQNSTTGGKTIIRVPASRSSSSGSSVGLTVRKPPVKAAATLGSTSFKENQQSGGAASSRIAARSAIMASRSNLTSPNHVNSSNRTTANSKISTTGSNSNSNSNRLSGFMRPTASSTTKRQLSDGKGK